jgi:glycerol-3-phosphate O-acyltransferase/dihydroxyacetone phosphate acyltransferase
MPQSTPLLYRACRLLLRSALSFYFARIERFHLERVPETGPVLFASNHPNSLTDAFVIGASVRRKVNFVATVQLFRFAPLRWFLLRCGVIPINRVKDDPRAMRSVLSTFEACFKVLEKGEAIAIFPEGITHDDPQLKTVKTGAARMALELEHRHAGKLGLTIVPVGLSFSAKDKYRSAILLHFGTPIHAADFLADYGEKKHQCIQALSSEIEARIQELMVHLEHLERARIVEAVKRLYLDTLRLGNTTIQTPVQPLSEELLLTQAIARAVDFSFENHPERATRFVRGLRRYETLLGKLRLSEDLLVHFPERHSLLSRSAWWALGAVLFAPVAAYGWIHRLVPYLIVKLIIERAKKAPADKTHVSTAALVSGLVVFTFFYALYATLVSVFFGWRPALIYAATLPIASLGAHYYLQHLNRFAAGVRVAGILLRAPSAARHVLARRAALIEQIEAERELFIAAAAERSGVGQ